MKIAKYSIIALLFVLAENTFAGKVVVFDLRKALFQTDDAKQRLAALEQSPEYAKLVAQTEGLRADLAILAKEEENKGLTWSAAQKSEHAKKAEDVRTQYRNSLKKVQDQQESLQRELLETGQAGIRTVLDQMVKAEDIDLILRAEVAFLAGPESDITPAVIAELNKLAKNEKKSK